MLDFCMTRDEIQQRYILGFEIVEAKPELGRATNISELWRSALEKCFSRSRDEVLDAVYNLPREQVSLIRFVSEGDQYFTTGTLLY